MTAPARSSGALLLNATLLFPISGNPIGFNHFAAAEWLLRQHPEWSRVCFVLSNGRHPDPTKADASVSREARLALCQAAIGAVAEPARSDLARQAEAAGERLRCGPDTLGVSTAEFAFDRAVRTAELIPRLLAGAPHPPGPGQWFAGSDLIRRMADARIFAAEDLALLAARCHYHVLERDEDVVADALAALEAARGVRLACTAYPRSTVPAWLAWFLELSSTRIRQAAEAGDPLSGMVPLPVAEAIAADGHYRAGETAARLLAPDGRALGTRSELALALDALQAELGAAADALAEALLARRAREQPHGLAVLETTTGGLITAALAGRSGASRYFRQSRFAYDAHAKTTLLGGALPAGAVSEESALALAQAMREAARADYALAESGMAGPPELARRSRKFGQCCIAVAGPAGAVAQTVRLSPFLTRREHQLAFARAALALAERHVRQDSP